MTTCERLVRHCTDHSGAVYAEQRIIGGSAQLCSPTKWLFTNDTYLGNYAAVEGGVLAWNFNDVQTFSPCPYVACEDNQPCATLM